MPYSYNGWSASDNLAIRDLFINGVEIVPGVRDNDDVYTVLKFVAQQFNDRVEKLVPGWCWGYNYRYTTNDSTLSCHASGTAEDLNAPLHPFGVSVYANFDQRQVDIIHDIIKDLPIVWGGDYRDADNKDGMHFEIMGSASAVAAAADRIRNGYYNPKDWFDMASKEDLREVVQEPAFIKAIAAQVLATKIEVTKADGTKVNKSVEALLRETWQKSL